MDSNCRKRSKVDATAVIPAEKEDRLGDLPDEIICHILWFLPTKCAIKTTVLSSRWMDLYLGIPDIHYAIALEKCWMRALEMLTTFKERIKDLEEKFDTLAEHLNVLSETLALEEGDNEGGEPNEGEETGNEEAHDDEEDGDADEETVSDESRDDDE